MVLSLYYVGKTIIYIRKLKKINGDSLGFLISTIYQKD